MTDPVQLIHQARDELERLSVVKLRDLPAQSARDIRVAVHLLEAARRRCGIKDEQQARAPMPKPNGGR